MTTKTAWIKSQLLPNETASNAASRLNTQIAAPNSAPRSQVSKPIDLVLLRANIPDLEAFQVLSNPIWDRITTAIGQGDTVTIVNHMKALLAGGLISAETVATITPMLQLTQPDPNWQPMVSVSIAMLAGFDLVYVHEVQEAIDAD